jgi:hypothetical protein
MAATAHLQLALATGYEQSCDTTNITIPRAHALRCVRQEDPPHKETNTNTKHTHNTLRSPACAGLPARNGTCTHRTNLRTRERYVRPRRETETQLSQPASRLGRRQRHSSGVVAEAEAASRPQDESPRHHLIGVRGQFLSSQRLLQGDIMSPRHHLMGVRVRSTLILVLLVSS